ncbi:hypothetical protein MBM_02348 [Drepanopeziza brunnea f. sp. 'multigermtubi' MB_m1]|uniref:Uncharacterized protein n=1 Tax=Marssonina brunnea f. sp. multigermtubi (strain MB_m1) TaxID=1072389 RepID=K1X1M3_MARBU|nr:uncharacterized protein MBM_02348 [Drepanopeziza brunnea f. sp. 'multigermtubi' MB_m1]EKD19111.1 hypothetical protein MBM_02348 [Drepanopeziza brunnea f. sp. 'multigermtubi' MB_m1]
MRKIASRRGREQQQEGRRAGGQEGEPQQKQQAAFDPRRRRDGHARGGSDTRGGRQRPGGTTRDSAAGTTPPAPGRRPHDAERGLGYMFAMAAARWRYPLAPGRPACTRPTLHRAERRGTGQTLHLQPAVLRPVRTELAAGREADRGAAALVRPEGDPGARGHRGRPEPRGPAARQCAAGPDRAHVLSHEASLDSRVLYGESGGMIDGHPVLDLDEIKNQCEQRREGRAGWNIRFGL